MSLRVCDTGSLAGTLGAAPGGGGASGGDPRCCWAGVWRGPTNDLCRVRRAGEGPAGERRVRADYPRGSGRARAAMQAEEVTQELRVLWARRARCAMESERNKELLWHLGKRQQQLQEALELVEVESSVVAQRLHQNRQELQQLEGLVARAKEQAEVARRTAAARREEAEEADRRQGKAEAGAAVPELTKRERWAELAKAVGEQAELMKHLRNKLQLLLQRREGLREPTALPLSGSCPRLLPALQSPFASPKGLKTSLSLSGHLGAALEAQL
ncbi:dynein regulatory complex protein 12 [Rhynochetos jubatus]